MKPNPIFAALAVLAPFALLLPTQVAAELEPDAQATQTTGATVGAELGSSYSLDDSYSKTKFLLGIESSEVTGVYGSVGGSNTVRETNGSFRCEADRRAYVGAVVLLVKECILTPDGEVASAQIAICSGAQRGLACDTPQSFTDEGTVIPGSESTIGDYTLTATCAGLECELTLRQSSSLSVDANKMDEAAAEILAADGEAGLVNAIQQTTQGSEYSDAMVYGGTQAECARGQLNELVEDGIITTCDGGASAEFGDFQDCIPVNPWKESCQVDIPTRIVECDTAELTCHRERPYVQESCDKVLVTNWVEDCTIPVITGLSNDWQKKDLNETSMGLWLSLCSNEYGKEGGLCISKGAGGNGWYSAEFNIEKLNSIKSFKLAKEFADDWIAIYVNNQLVFAGHCGSETFYSNYLFYNQNHEDKACIVDPIAPEEFSYTQSFLFGVSQTYTGIVIGHQDREVDTCLNWVPGDPVWDDLCGCWKDSEKCTKWEKQTLSFPRVMIAETAHTTRMEPNLELKPYLIEGPNRIDIGVQTVDLGHGGAEFIFEWNCPQVPQFTWDDQCTDLEGKAL